MLMHIPMIVLTSHLVVAVADHPPTFDICARLQSRQRIGVRSQRRHERNDKAVHGRRTAGEGSARDTMVGVRELRPRHVHKRSSWQKADAEADPPSYVELLTCIQDAQLARKLPKN
jgi:hypothetical protein